MKYNDKLKLIETIKYDATLFIKEYANAEETSMNKLEKEFE